MIFKHIVTNFVAPLSLMEAIGSVMKANRLRLSDDIWMDCMKTLNGAKTIEGVTLAVVLMDQEGYVETMSKPEGECAFKASELVIEAMKRKNPIAFEECGLDFIRIAPRLFVVIMDDEEHIVDVRVFETQRP